MITSFSGVHRWLSNFWPAEVEFCGKIYPTVEHAYQAAKTRNTAEREAIRTCATPGQAKRLGRSVKMRDDWNDIKRIVMYNLVYVKFNNNPVLKENLLATVNQVLVEGNKWNDTYWGVCNGVGQNNLGVILMQVREKLVMAKQSSTS